MQSVIPFVIKRIKHCCQQPFPKALSFPISTQYDQDFCPNAAGCYLVCICLCICICICKCTCRCRCLYACICIYNLYVCMRVWKSTSIIIPTGIFGVLCGFVQYHSWQELWSLWTKQQDSSKQHPCYNCPGDGGFLSAQRNGTSWGLLNMLYVKFPVDQANKQNHMGFGPLFTQWMDPWKTQLRWGKGPSALSHFV